MIGSPADFQFLTPTESAEVDKALLTSADKFATRLAIYALRCLQQIVTETGTTIEQVTPEQVLLWIEKDASFQQQIEVDRNFTQFFTQLIISSLQPLTKIANSHQKSMANLTVQEVVSGFEELTKKIKT